jgi:hypothetical protein
LFFVYIAKKNRKYQRGNQKPYIEEEETTQWPKEKVQKDKQRSTKHTYKTKDRVTRTPLKTGGELRCSGRVSSSCSTSENPITFFLEYRFHQDHDMHNGLFSPISFLNISDYRLQPRLFMGWWKDVSNCLY